MWSEGHSGYVAVWPLTASDGTVKGVLVYDVPRDELGDTLAYLRYGILGAILTSILLAGAASVLLTRQVTRPLSETRDAAIRVASGDYAATVPVKSRDELGEVARTFNYMAEEIEHYVGEIQEQKSRLEAVLQASPEARRRHGPRRARNDGQPRGGQDARHQGLGQGTHAGGDGDPGRRPEVRARGRPQTGSR